ncbi:MAG: hypothetical protein P9X24_06280 [Candidatus Hatepunaea meridiana]|nr:hypothetical protein [Candidatus Hatepunaea meridiana]
MNTEPLTTEEKFLEAYKIVFDTTDVVNNNFDTGLSEMPLDCGYQENRMPDEDMPLIDACPFYGRV